ncbi:polysaccharide biosynthesis protein, partial [Escherichia coli]|nr:polysaccharide biosynthesis protein [Escherichia coli]EHC8053452.1 polysaccharide biosynthesis protein [Escherichia coli]
IALYAMREDRYILVSQLISFLSFLLFVFFSVYQSDIYYLLIGMIASFVLLLILKMIPLYKILKKV